MHRSQLHDYPDPCIASRTVGHKSQWNRKASKKVFVCNSLHKKLLLCNSTNEMGSWYIVVKELSLPKRIEHRPLKLFIWINISAVRNFDYLLCCRLISSKVFAFLCCLVKWYSRWCAHYSLSCRRPRRLKDSMRCEYHTKENFWHTMHV